jgi:hypothetical protein
MGYLHKDVRHCVDSLASPLFSHENRPPYDITPQLVYVY